MSQIIVSKLSIELLFSSHFFSFFFFVDGTTSKHNITFKEIAIRLNIAT